MNITLFLGIATASLFSFLSVAVWSNARRREREAYYRSEIVQRLATAGDRAEVILQFVRESEKSAKRERHHGLQLRGLITIAIGAGMMIFIRAVERADPYAFLVGLIPVLVGVVVLAHCFTLKSQE
jgi:hypothetical protein